ncbi:MAG: hypothetical protein AB1499_00010 [Nitrospirota bacterium]
MKLEISEQAINNTKRCRKNFACLSGSGHCLCKLTYCFNGKSYFIKPERNLLCNYKVTFSGSVLCSCPTRKEIYNRYRI